MSPRECDCPAPPCTCAPRPAEPTGELREQIAEAIAGTVNGVATDLTRRMADALLSGPLAPLLAKLRAMEALADEFDANGNSRELGDPRAATWHKAADRIRAAALDAEPVPDG